MNPVCASKRGALGHLHKSIVLLLVLSSAGSAVHATRPANVTDGEIALLPPFCIDTEAFKYGSQYAPNRSPRASHWEGLMGQGFWSLHHYCWGLVELRRLQFTNPRAPLYKARVEQVVNEFNYVLRSTTPGFVMLPEVWTRTGDAWVLGQNWAGAREAYEKARALRPDYWPAYSRWAEALVKLGLKAEAAALVREGLEHSPEAEALLLLANQLKVPVPVKPSAANAAKASPAASEAASAPAATAPASSASAPTVQ